ncbi:MAG: 5'/3'-nucleotidase SurE [Bacteroidia bacterium]|nr:5'/3'-nucleotidase SurE [Bacteroidia bacterium]
MAKRPHFLISNDDGIHAPGIMALLEVARELGETTVVAPNSAQSAMGHAISIGKPLRIYQEELPGGLIGHAVSGTPADCVKIATGVVMKTQPDLILSGINHGANSSVSAIYSGTLSAAREGALQGLPAIGFSLCHFPHEGDMSAAKIVAKTVIEHALTSKLLPGQCLNVNIPYLPIEKIKGIRITRQAMGRWMEEFDERTDPYGRKYYWLTGKFILQDKGVDTDEHALAEGYVSITPMSHDLTAHHQLPALTEWPWELPAS